MALEKPAPLKQSATVYAAGAPVTIGELRELGVSPQLAYWYANNGCSSALGEAYSCATASSSIYEHHSARWKGKLLMEGLLTLHTDVLQRLLEKCTSVKTVRLFLTLSRELSLPHMTTLKVKALPKGSSASRYVYRGRGETLVLKA